MLGELGLPNASTIVHMNNVLNESQIGHISLGENDTRCAVYLKVVAKW